MASDSLLIQINPLLLEAMQIPGDAGSVDYFTFLGLEAEGFKPADVDGAVMLRSKQLRPWQNSPQHGEEAVKLLPMIHRVAAVLKDPVRRDAYKNELAKVLQGIKSDPIADFAEMVRAALADGAIDQASKAELMRYARENQIPMEEVGRIVRELAATAMDKSAAAHAEEPDEELRLEADGAEVFQTHISALLLNGELNAETAKAAIADASKYGISESLAASIIERMTVAQFQRLVRHVAKKGVINNNQARLLMPKAQALGLSQDKAYEVLSAFTFTGASQEELGRMQLSSASFDSSEIGELLAKQKTVHVVNRWQTLAMYVPPWLIWGVLAVAAIGVVSYLASSFLSGINLSPAGVVGSQSPTPTPAGPATTQPAGSESVALKPDPASGLLEFKPQLPEDPPLFQMKITEVTCREYQEFLLATLYRNRPEGWGVDLSFPQGTGNHPVTGISWTDANEYLKWLAGKKGIPADRLRLPSVPEYLRVLRGTIFGGRSVSDNDFWNRIGLTAPTARAAKASRNDTLLFDNGQIYDLIANVSEWGADEQDGKRALLGGNFSDSAPGFDPRNARFADPAMRSATIGFRYVIVGPATP